MMSIVPEIVFNYLGLVNKRFRQILKITRELQEKEPDMSKRKPKLVLHPGFPKCATSSIQRMFVIKDHALANEMGVKFIGRNFLPNNGYPEVIRLMDEPEKCKLEVNNYSYPDGDYFLSNEAVSGKPEFLQELQSKFDICKSVFTIRMPTIQAISEYRYSGWIKQPLARCIDDQSNNSSDKIINLETQISYIRSKDIPTILTPIEGNIGTLIDRFCEDAFERKPGCWVDKNTMDINKSIDLAFASALHTEISKMSLKEIPPSLRRSLVHTAQQWKVEDSLSGLASEEILYFSHRVRAEMRSGYHEMLLRNGVKGEVASSAAEAANEGLCKMSNTPIATNDQMRGLEAQAKLAIQAARAKVADDLH